MPRRQRPDIIPILALLAAVLLLLAGWKLFPLLQAYVSHQDCVAAGYTNCSGQVP